MGSVKVKHSNFNYLKLIAKITILGTCIFTKSSPNLAVSPLHPSRCRMALSKAAFAGFRPESFLPEQTNVRNIVTLALAPFSTGDNIVNDNLR